MQPLVTAIIILGASLASAQHDPYFVDGRNTIVHLFEWKWSDIASECENFLSKKGFGGVQIAPPSENVIVNNRPWWEKYQPISYILSNRNGDENALADMIRRCNNVGVRIYVDLVVNHMAAASGSGTAGNTCDPDHKCYPGVPYSDQNFHPSCDINYNDAISIRNCELASLKDLDQSQNYVREKIIDFMNHLINLGIAGFRVDAAKHMWPDDLTAIYGSVNDLSPEFFPPGSRAFYYQEVVDMGTDPVHASEYRGLGRVCEFKYGNMLTNCFKGNNPLKYLENWGTGWGMMDSSVSLVFIENHDKERSGEGYLNYKESKPYKAAIAFMLAHPYGSVTQVMSSYAFDNSNQGPPANGDQILSPGFNDDGTCTNGWICQHRWSPIFNMVEFRNVVSGTGLNNWWVGGDNQIAFSRGDKGLIATSINGYIDANIPTSLPDGTYCDVISGSYRDGSCTGKIVKVSDRQAYVQIFSGDQEAALAIHVKAKL